MARIELDNEGRVLPSLGSVLGAALPSKGRLLLRKVVKEAEKQSLPIYLVGGFVRDLILGRPSLDLDLVLEGDAIRFGRRLVQLFGGRLVPHKAFGTAVWWLSGRKRQAGQLAFMDLISARRENYTQPAALPQVARAEIAADQFRRDFTINTLALALNGLHTGRVLDPWGGLRDLDSRLIRTLHPLSFMDDPTRAFRALRLAGRLDFRIETSTLRHLQAALPKLKLLSGDRLRNELELVLAEPNRVEILQAVQFLGVLPQIDKQLLFLPKAAALLVKADGKAIPTSWNLEEVSAADLGFVLWFMHLSPKFVDRIANRLRFNADLRSAVLAAARLLAESKSLRLLPVSRLVARLDQAPLLATYALFLAHRGTTFGKKLEKFAKDWRHIQPFADGHTLKKKGLRPGPAYTQVLSRLRAARLDGEVRTAKQEASLLEKLIHEHR